MKALIIGMTMILTSAAQAAGGPVTVDSESGDCTIPGVDNVNQAQARTFCRSMGVYRMKNLVPITSGPMPGGYRYVDSNRIIGTGDVDPSACSFGTNLQEGKLVCNN